MKKNRFFTVLFSLITVVFVSCTDNDFNNEIQESDITNPAQIKLITDQSLLASRLFLVTPDTKKLGTRAVVNETPAPAIPEGALKLSEQPTNWNNDVSKNIYILPNAVLTYCESREDNKVKIPKAIMHKRTSVPQ